MKLKKNTFKKMNDPFGDFNERVPGDKIDAVRF